MKRTGALEQNAKKDPERSEYWKDRVCVTVQLKRKKSFHAPTHLTGSRNTGTKWRTTRGRSIYDMCQGLKTCLLFMSNPTAKIRPSAPLSSSMDPLQGLSVILTHASMLGAAAVMLPAPVLCSSHWNQTLMKTWARSRGLFHFLIACCTCRKYQIHSPTGELTQRHPQVCYLVLHIKLVVSQNVDRAVIRSHQWVN